MHNPSSESFKKENEVKNISQAPIPNSAPKCQRSYAQLGNYRQNVGSLS